MMKNALTAVIALFILGACVSYQHERRFGADGGGYYIAESPPSVSYYYAPYGALYGYGITPWWGYAYHSPYFYPHDFHVWYAPWPYYAAWPYYSPWYAAHFHRYPHYLPPPGHDGGGRAPGAPLPDYSGTPVVPPAGVRGPWRVADERDRSGEPRYGRPNPGMPASPRTARSFPAGGSLQAPVGRASLVPRVNTGIAAPPGSIGAPSAPAVGGRASPVPVPEPGPARHNQ